METTIVAGGHPPSEPGFTDRILGLTLRPLTTMEDASNRLDWLRPASMILVGHVLMWAPAYYHVSVAYGPLMRTMASQPGSTGSGGTRVAEEPFVGFISGIMGASMAMQVLQIIPMVAASWFLRCGLFYLVGRVMLKGRERSFWSLFTTVGWAWWPLFLQSAICGILFLVVPGAWRHLIPMPTDAEDLASPMASLKMMSGTASLMVLHYASPLAWWNWFLCILAVQASLQLDRARAYLVVAVQVLLHLGWTTGTYFLARAVGQWMTNLGASPSG